MSKFLSWVTEWTAQVFGGYTFDDIYDSTQELQRAAKQEGVDVREVIVQTAALTDAMQDATHVVERKINPEDVSLPGSENTPAADFQETIPLPDSELSPEADFPKAISTVGSSASACLKAVDQSEKDLPEKAVETKKALGNLRKICHSIKRGADKLLKRVRETRTYKAAKRVGETIRRVFTGKAGPIKVLKSKLGRSKGGQALE